MRTIRELGVKMRALKVGNDNSSVWYLVCMNEDSWVVSFGLFLRLELGRKEVPLLALFLYKTIDISVHLAYFDSLSTCSLAGSPSLMKLDYIPNLHFRLICPLSITCVMSFP